MMLCLSSEQLTPIMQKMYDPNLEAYYYCNTVSGRKSYVQHHAL